MRIFRLTYFLLPATSTDSAMNNLKQCLHYDPDSKECFAARRLVKNFGKTFDKLQNLLNSEDWKGAISLLEKGGFPNKYDQALDAETTREVLGLPPWLSLTPPRKSSPRREVILRGLCKSYVRIGQPKKGAEWCQALGQMVGGHEDAMHFLVKERSCLQTRNMKRRLESWRGLGMLVEGRIGSSNRG
jgi:DnaJ family protein C protein 3